MANASLWGTRLTTTSSNDLENEIHFANLLPPNLAHSARFLCQDHNNKSHFSSQSLSISSCFCWLGQSGAVLALMRESERFVNIEVIRIGPQMVPHQISSNFPAKCST